MSKHSFMDTILNRPSQKYTEPVSQKSSSSRHYGGSQQSWQAPSNLPNASAKPDSILAGNMFKSSGHGSLSRGGTASQAPSVSGMSNTSRFSVFRRKKNRAPSISGVSIFSGDGASSVAPTDITSSPRKGRWWETSTFKKNKYSSRPPSVAGSIFSEPEAAGPPGFPYLSSHNASSSAAPVRTARSDYGGPTSRIRYSSHPTPPVPKLHANSSISSLRRQSGVAPLGQQAPNLMRQSSKNSLNKAAASSTSASMSRTFSNPPIQDPSRPVSPAASMGRGRSQSRASQAGSSDWNSFVKSMSGTEVAKMWESMPTLAPKPPSRSSVKRSTVVADRIKKELQQDAQYEQVIRDPGVVQQDLLARAASQVIGDMPPTPVSSASHPQAASLPLHPGQIVPPISPIQSPVASTSSVNLASVPQSISAQVAPIVAMPVTAPPPAGMQYQYQLVPVLVDGQQRTYPVAQQPHQQIPTMPNEPIAFQPAMVSTEAVPPPQVATVPTFAPVPLAPKAQTQPHVASMQDVVQPPILHPAAQTGAQLLQQPEEASSQPIIQRAHESPVVAAVSGPSTAQYLAQRLEEEEASKGQPERAAAEEVESEDEDEDLDEEESEDETSSEEEAGISHPTLDVVAEEEEETSSAGHAYHHEMRSHRSIKGKGFNRRYDNYSAHLQHRRQSSSQSQDQSFESAELSSSTSGPKVLLNHTQDDSTKELEPAKDAQVSMQDTAEKTVADEPPATTAVKAVPVDLQSVQPAVSSMRDGEVLGSTDTTQQDSLPTRPALVSRISSTTTEYQSATSGRSTPTSKGVSFEGAPLSKDQASRADDDDGDSETVDGKSIAPSQRAISIRSSRSSRPGTAQRRLSDISLGTSFAVSGILGARPGSSSRRSRANGDDSDSEGEHSGDDAQLKAMSLAEQQRLRSMNVGEDFFGPSISNILDKFDNMNYSDTTIGRLGLETRESPSSSKAQKEASLRDSIAADAQKTINEIRQKRVENSRSEGTNKRNSVGTELAPSIAAVWLLNQDTAQDMVEGNLAEGQPSQNGSITPSSSMQDTSSSFATPASKYASQYSDSTPTKPAESVMNRPRPKAARPQEMGGLSISQGKLEAVAPASPVEDTRSTLPMPLSQPSTASPGPSPTKVAAEDKIVVTIQGLPSKEKPAPAKSAMKPKQSRSLADTLFGITLRSPGKDKEKKEKKAAKKEKKDKKDKSKHNRKASMDSIGSRSTKSEQSLGSEGVTVTSSSNSIVAGVAGSDTTAVKQEATADQIPDQRKLVSSSEDSQMVPSETIGHFSTPLQSMANINGAGSPEKFHTAHDLKALATATADTEIPVYPSLPSNIGRADEQLERGRQLPERTSTQDPANMAVDQVPGTENVNNDELARPGVSTIAQGQLHHPKERQPSASSASVDDSLRMASSQASVVSTALTSPMTSDDVAMTSIPISDGRKDTVKASSPDQPMDPTQKRLPMPPPPAPEDVVTMAYDDRTPTGQPHVAANVVGINLIPPTPPALEHGTSYPLSKAPGTPTIDEQEDPIAQQPQRPPMVSRTSSQRTAGKSSDSGKDAKDEKLARSKSVSTAKKGIWTEYTGKGLSLPPGLVATTIDSSKLRRMSVQEKKAALSEVEELAPKAKRVSTSSSLAPASASASASVPPVVQTLVPVPVMAPQPQLVPGQVIPHQALNAPLQTIPEPSQMSPISPVRSSPSPSPKSGKRRSISPGGLSQSPSMNKIMAGAPPVPQLPVGYQGAGSTTSSSSRLYAPSGGSSDPDSDSRSVSPAPSAVPSQSGRSNVSHVSSSYHSTSYRSSPRPEYTYVNNHELSPYAKKMRALSPSPSVPTLNQTGNRHSLMSAINEWESQVPDSLEDQAFSPYPSRPTSPHPYPALPASTVSRTSSVISSMSSPSVVRNAPLGASTNQYLHLPIARSRMTAEDRSGLASIASESNGHLPFNGVNASVASSISSSRSASQSALSLTSTLPTSMPTVPTSYRPNKDPKRFSTNAEDLLNNRTTMQTVAVSSGAFPTRSRSMVKRKKSADLNGDRRSSFDIPEHLQDELALTTLSLTAHTPPPRKITSHQVLVQIIAVAIDEMDKLLLRERVRSDSAFGFVPGRSFCGRIVECGYEVKKMRKGDMVFGLQDSRKSGALAEFMTIDHNLICHAPSDCLTTEQIAALPSAGVMAHQLIQNHCRPLSRGARVLILNAHDGVGLLTMQESVGLGLIIVAQCPPSVSDGVAVCQANGAHEVVIGEPLWAINSLHESSFDLVIDTIGGRKIYDASRRVLAFEGQFCTCYGDEHSTANPNLKSHFRSLRRAFFKKDKKNLGYEWVGVDTGEDCREALEAVKRAAEAGNVCPRLRSILPFADAPRAFDPTSRNVDDEPGAIVVRVS